MVDFVEINIGVTGPAQSDLLVATLSELGFDGFEEREGLLLAYTEAGRFDEDGLRALLDAHGVQYTKKEIPDTNWNETWEKHFEPVRVGDFCAIRASHHAPARDVQYEVLITPKMSFGTGHHATTYMMVDSMSRLDFSGKRVLDFGTGTGVLAILAEKMGAQSVLAIDNDAWSIENATENIQVNECKKIILRQADQPRDAGHFDVILANINKNLIISNLDALKQQLAEDGVLLLSGLLTTDLEDIRNVLGKSLSIVSMQEKKGWICLVVRKQ